MKTNDLVENVIDFRQRRHEYHVNLSFSAQGLGISSPISQKQLLKIFRDLDKNLTRIAKEFKGRLGDSGFGFGARDIQVVFNTRLNAQQFVNAVRKEYQNVLLDAFYTTYDKELEDYLEGDEHEGPL